MILCFAPSALGQASTRICLDKALPVYPQIARQIRREGVVTLLATVEPDGHVSAAKVISGHPILVSAAVAAAMRWKFVPCADTDHLNLHIEFKL